MIKILFMDVDGTLTDGTIYIGNNGEEFKCFNVKDGYGISQILKKNGIIPVVVTGRESKIVEERCRELGIVEVIQNSSDKVKDINKVLGKYGLKLEDAAYIGDDLNDLGAIKLVAISGSPADAVDIVKKNCDYVTEALGGRGAVREFIEWVVDNT